MFESAPTAMLLFGIDGRIAAANRSLETLLGSEEMRRLGAVVAVDAEGVLRGVVTLNALRQALRSGQDQDAVTPG